MRKTLAFVYGSVLGALVGATIALLLTPYSGTELRSQVEDRALYLKTELKQAAAARRVELERQLAALRAPRDVTLS